MQLALQPYLQLKAPPSYCRLGQSLELLKWEKGLVLLSPQPLTLLPSLSSLLEKLWWQWCKRGTIHLRGQELLVASLSSFWCCYSLCGRSCGCVCVCVCGGVGWGGGGGADLNPELVGSGKIRFLTSGNLNLVDIQMLFLSWGCFGLLLQKTWCGVSLCVVQHRWGWSPPLPFSNPFLHCGKYSL